MKRLTYFNKKFFLGRKKRPTCHKDRDLFRWHSTDSTYAPIDRVHRRPMMRAWNAPINGAKTPALPTPQYRHQ